MTILLKPGQEHRIAEALRSGAGTSSNDVMTLPWKCCTSRTNG